MQVKAKMAIRSFFDGTNILIDDDASRTAQQDGKVSRQKIESRWTDEKRWKRVDQEMDKRTKA